MTESLENSLTIRCGRLAEVASQNAPRMSVKSFVEARSEKSRKKWADGCFVGMKVET